MDNFNDVYNILSNIEKFDMREYNKLTRKYDKELIDYVINKLVLEDEENMNKFSVYFDNIDDSVESKMNLLNYGLYLTDLRRLECYDSEKNMELLVKAHEYILQMDEIFNQCGVNSLNLGKKELWISDKVEWCLRYCRDIKLLSKLNSLYSDYINIRNQIVNGNLRFVLYIVHQYNDDLTMIEDMIQYGNMGLIRAIEKFDISKNTSFTTYASYWIRQAVARGVKSTKYAMRMPMHIIYKNSLMIDTEDKLSVEEGRSITDIELANYMGLSLINMEQIINAFKVPSSMDEVIPYEYDDSDRVRIVGDYVADLNVDVCKDATSLEYREELLKFLSDNLLEREYMVLYLYYGFSGEDYTDKEIAKEMGMSQQRIGQIKKEALTKLRKKRNIRDIVIV